MRNTNEKYIKNNTNNINSGHGFKTESFIKRTANFNTKNLRETNIFYDGLNFCTDGVRFKEIPMYINFKSFKK